MTPRLIESAFPLRQVSLDSVHEKNIRHGHISTLHIWPARRPLAASRAVLLATLLPDPDTPAARNEMLRRIAGSVVEVPNASGDRMREVTQGGIIRWGREDGTDIETFRRQVRSARGGRAPRVLDPFAGGGAIPLEAMRLGCETAASDLNPVAWFILRCTLHYPRLVAGRKQPLPAFALRDREFTEQFLKRSLGFKGKRALREGLAVLGHGGGVPARLLSPQMALVSPDMPAPFAWHLRAWGRRVLSRARRRLAARYPTYAEFEPRRRKGRARRHRRPEKRYRPRPPHLLLPDDQGNVSVASLNAEFDSYYLEDHSNPRWVAKPPVAYLWARTVRCTGCRAEVPLLKTRWLCKKGTKRVLLTMKTDKGSVSFGIENDAPRAASGSTARGREHDRQLGEGTMSRSGTTCPCYGVTATMSDLRVQGRAGRLGERMTAVVVDGQQGKEYRLPTEEELAATRVSEEELEALYAEIPFGMPDEPTPKAGIGASRAFSVDGYGFTAWRTLFTDRQLLALGTLVREIRTLRDDLDDYPEEWREALWAYLSCILSKLTDYSSSICSWHNSGEKLSHTFARFALPMVWDYCEVNPLSATTGGFAAMTEWVARYLDRTESAVAAAPLPEVLARSATDPHGPKKFDLICTDPPYYDAIPYSDLMDFFHVWLRRVLHGLSPETDAVFAAPLAPKWDADAGDGELIDDAARFGGDRKASKQNFEDGMARAFSRFWEALRDDGRMVIVFANKQPDAWETLVSALIRAGFVVVGSWPIQTEMQNRQRSLESTALSSSVWLVCRKRPAAARPGWDGPVLREMRENITNRLRDFWDAGIRGPDFVWAATGPALEAFSRHPVVRKTDRPGELLTVAEFLRQVRRMVVGFVVGRLFGSDSSAEEELDDPTTYYLLHRTTFGLDPAPAGACILYAVSCNLADADLAGRLDLLARGRGGGASEPERDRGGAGSASGSKVRLKGWNRRRTKTLGQPAAGGGQPSLIDCVHKTMQLWKTGEQTRVNAYLEGRGLWRHELFARVVQALIELAEAGSEERATLEKIQNHLAARRGAALPRQTSVL